MNRDIGTRIKESVSPGGRGDVPGILRRGRRLRRRRMIATAASVGILVTASIAVFSRVVDDGFRVPARRAPAAQATASPAQDDSEFHPETHEEAGMRVMELTFLDGSYVEMLYPADLGLEALDVVPRGDVILDHYDFVFGHDDGSATRGTVLVRWRGDDHRDTPTADETGPGGQTVRRWRPVPTEEYSSDGDYGLGPWVVRLHGGLREEPLARETADAIVQHLWGLETEAGFLALDSDGPLELWPGDEGPALLEVAIGPRLTLLSDCMSGGSGERQQVEGRDVYVHGDGSRTWCDTPDGVTIQATDPDVAGRLSRELRFRSYDRVSGSRP